MIIWINGAFGSGKTTVAHELHRRIPDSHVYDPENVGYFIWKNAPKSFNQGDFQDFPQWRSMNYDMLKMISDRFDGPIIVPMTLVNPQYFGEIVGRLRADGADVRHFALLASRETLLKRLRKRGDRSDSWPARQIDRCAASLSGELFGHHIHTDHRTVEEVAERIASEAGIRLAPDSRGWLRKRIDRMIVTIKHIRI
ncbi:AAA family ATPase [Cohnella panacarvi]|uniref:AAA family ATPase n=1 Tax=Cohnella panacarvi TaxID=400776 RepID=UPI0004799D68|nr:AAA family ATPase [Cohnella panacarvi]